MKKAFNQDPLLLDLPAPIVTPRLEIRPPQSGEGAVIADAVRESWPDLHKWEDWAKNRNIHATAKYWEARTRRELASYILRETLTYRIYSRATNEFIGITDLCQPNWEVRSFIAGYWIRSNEQNKGFATEAMNGLLRFAFNVLSASYVGLGHAVHNEASQRVIQKLNFTFLGERPNVLALRGEIVGDKIYYKDNLDGLPDLNVGWGESAKLSIEHEP